MLASHNKISDINNYPTIVTVTCIIVNTTIVTVTCIIVNTTIVAAIVIIVNTAIVTARGFHVNTTIVTATGIIVNNNNNNMIIFIETRLQDTIGKIIKTDGLVNRVASSWVIFESSP